MVTTKLQHPIERGHIRFIYQSCSRPQLPFLLSPLRFRAIPNIQPQRQQQHKSIFQNPWRPQLQKLGQRQLVRLLTTERKQYFIKQIWLGGRIAAFGYAAVILLLIASTDYYLEVAEYRHPSPPEWSLWTRVLFRFARAAEDEGSTRMISINWVDVWSWNKKALMRLENTEGYDGQGVDHVEGRVATSGVGSISASLDISRKTEPWRRGYYDVLMSMARAAEHIDGWVKDRTQNMCFPPEYIVRDDGQANQGPETATTIRPPKAVPPEKGMPPLIANCEIIANSPQTIYAKILTTRGFTSSQRVEAALAYAAWLEFKGLYDAAKETYLWAFDIAFPALSGRTPVASSDELVKLIHPGGPPPTKNMLKVSTAYAIHLASYKQDFDAALSMLLSILATRRRAQPDLTKSMGNGSSSSSSSASSSSPPPYAVSSNGYKSESTKPSLLVSIFRSRRYPSEPSSGDETFTRGQTADCDDAAMMLHIGEILFASGAQLNSGIQWTSEGTQLAENQWRTSQYGTRQKERCKDCLKIGLDNWKAMLTNLGTIEREKLKIEKLAPEDKYRNFDILGVKGCYKQMREPSYQGLYLYPGNSSSDHSEDWQKEKKKLEAWITKVKSEIFIEELQQYDKNNSWLFLK